MKKLTPPMRKLLEYLRDNGAIGFFPVAYSEAIRKKALAAEYIERADTRSFGLMKFRLSDKGRAALSDSAIPGVG